MSTLAANNITDAAGTGGPTLSNGLTIGTSVLAAPSGSAPSYTCRAWVNFNGTTNVGGFCTIRASGNVSSVADNGTGEYTVNFATNMPDANYAINVNINMDYNVANVFSPSLNTSGGGAAESAPTTSSCRFYCAKSNTAAFDPKYVNVSIFR
jgi:hypothetical protein